MNDLELLMASMPPPVARGRLMYEQVMESGLLHMKEAILILLRVAAVYAPGKAPDEAVELAVRAFRDAAKRSE